MVGSHHVKHGLNNLFAESLSKLLLDGVLILLRQKMDEDAELLHSANTEHARSADSEAGLVDVSFVVFTSTKEHQTVVTKINEVIVHESLNGILFL